METAVLGKDDVEKLLRKRFKEARITAEWVVIMDAIMFCGTQTKAAIVLRLDRKTLYNKIKAFERLNPKAKNPKS